MSISFQFKKYLSKIFFLFLSSFLFSQDVTLGLDGNNLNYTSNVDIAGFQFNHNGCILNISGGDAWYNLTVANDTQYFNEADYYFSRLLSGIDFRAKNLESFDNLEKNSMDFYASVKSLYLQDRRQKILNSKEVIDTMNDSDWEEIETQ